MSYFAQLFDLMVEVMLPVTLLVAAGAFWPRFFPDTQVELARTLLNRLAMYLFYPSILYAVAASTPVSMDLLSVPLLVGIGSLTSGALLYVLLYRLPLWPRLTDPARAGIMLGGMFGNTFNIGVPVLIFFYDREATRYAVFNDMLMTMPLVWSLGVWISTRLGSHAAVVEAATPPMLTALLLADRFRLDSAATALLLGWATILFWVTLPLIMALELIR